jgi:hypothetical protein
MAGTFLAFVLPNWLTAVKDGLPLLLMWFGVYAACKGVATWREQLRGKADYELARRLLRTAYTLRNAIREARFPAIKAVEMETALRELGESAEKGHADPERFSKARAEVWNLRGRKVANAAGDMSVEAFEAEVLWGDVAQKAAAPLRACVTKLNANLQLEFWRRHDRDIVLGLSTEQQREFQQVVPSRFLELEEDPFWREVLEATAEVEALVRPHLGSGRTRRLPGAPLAEWVRNKWKLMRRA